MSDPTITVTNLGDLGVDQVFGVIYPPQVALVGFGKVAERPWAEGGLLSARPTVTATLAADHRVSDGHRGGLFLSAIDHLLRTPEELSPETMPSTSCVTCSIRWRPKPTLGRSDRGSPWPRRSISTPWTS